MKEIKEQDLYDIGFKNSDHAYLLYNLPKVENNYAHYMVKYSDQNFVGYIRDMRFTRLPSLAVVKKIIALNPGGKND